MLCCAVRLALGVALLAINTAVAARESLTAFAAAATVALAVATAVIGAGHRRINCAGFIIHDRLRWRLRRQRNGFQSLAHDLRVQGHWIRFGCNGTVP